MEDSKISLSVSELTLFSNAQIILTKNTIIKKVVALLEQLQQNMQAENKILAQATTPKISKGENYLGLPYVVLDYPRLMNEKQLFFVRSIFWWGNFYSSTLQISGDFKHRNIFSLAEAVPNLSAGNYFIGINNDPWQHHFSEDNFIPINSLVPPQYLSILQRSEHVKIAAKWPLSEWEMAPERLLESWKMLTGLIT